jgi:hypothetical protein
MYWLTGLVALQDQDTGPFWVLGIILHDDRARKTHHDVPNLQVIGCQFIVPMGRYPHLALGREGSHPLECSTQRDSIIPKSDFVPLTTCGSPAAAHDCAAAVGCSRC